MSVPGAVRSAGAATAGALVLALAALTAGAPAVSAQGVGGASWTPLASVTTSSPATFFVPGDALVVRTDATWDQAGSESLASYQAQGLRYTHEANDVTGRLSATGYWATNHPDPAYDRDDDDGDGRWEETEVIAGTRPPEPDRTYTTLIQFSRWHAKRQAGEC